MRDYPNNGKISERTAVKLFSDFVTSEKFVKQMFDMCDNYLTHTLKSLVETYPPEKYEHGAGKMFFLSCVFMTRNINSVQILPKFSDDSMYREEKLTDLKNYIASQIQNKCMAVIQFDQRVQNEDTREILHITDYLPLDYLSECFTHLTGFAHDIISDFIPQFSADVCEIADGYSEFDYESRELYAELALTEYHQSDKFKKKKEFIINEVSQARDSAINRNKNNEN